MFRCGMLRHIHRNERRVRLHPLLDEPIYCLKDGEITMEKVRHVLLQCPREENQTLLNLVVIETLQSTQLIQQIGIPDHEDAVEQGLIDYSVWHDEDVILWQPF